MYVVGINNSGFSDESRCGKFAITGDIEIEGSVAGLIDFTKDDLVEVPNNYCFKSLFEGCSGLAKAPYVPFLNLKEYCYDSMFKGCTKIKQAPELLASKLVTGCYKDMFNGCSSLNSVKAMFSS